MSSSCLAALALPPKMRLTRRKDRHETFQALRCVCAPRVCVSNSCTATPRTSRLPAAGRIEDDALQGPRADGVRQRQSGGMEDAEEFLDGRYTGRCGPRNRSESDAQSREIEVTAGPHATAAGASRKSDDR